MAADLPPLAPVNPSPLVRPKRHYHGEHQQGSKHNKQSEADEQAENSETLEQKLKQEQSQENSLENGLAVSPKSLNNSVNQDEKHATVQHLDEYV